MNTKEYNIELKLNWRQRWLSSINELTNFELQNSSWLNLKVRNPHWSFVEFMCSYFDDLVLENNYKDPLERKLISNQELEIIIEWHKNLDQYESPNKNDYDHLSILKDTKWLEIIQIGIVSKNELVKIIDKNERQFLTEKINYFDYL